MDLDADPATLAAKRKKTASITCLVAAVLVLASLFLPWLKAAKGYDVSMSLLSIEACQRDRDYDTDKVTVKCESMSNLKLARQLKDSYQQAKELRAQFPDEDGRPARMPPEPGTSFAYFGLATLVIGILGALALGAAGGLGLKGHFVREPVALTSAALIALCLALVLGCIFVAVKPGDSGAARMLGVSWPFFVFGAGIVGGIAGAQMLAKAHAPPEYDPYAEPT